MSLESLLFIFFQTSLPRSKMRRTITLQKLSSRCTCTRPAVNDVDVLVNAVLLFLRMNRLQEEVRLGLFTTVFQHWNKEEKNHAHTSTCYFYNYAFNYFDERSKNIALVTDVFYF